VSESALSIKKFEQISDLPECLFHERQSFMRREFWLCLHQTGVIGSNASFKPHYLVLYQSDQPVAAIPVFERNDHYGEYVFDQLWADTYMRYGANYYPRLVTSIPYTPVKGARIWQNQSLDESSQLTLKAAIDDLATELGASSYHGLFWRGAPEHLTQTMSQRDECQFCWFNHLPDEELAYRDFDHFLEQLTAKKRRSIRAERRKVAAQEVSIVWKMGSLTGTGMDGQAYDLSQCEGYALGIDESDWVHFYDCYERTYHERGRAPYLPLAFFQALYAQMPESLALCVANQDSRPVAAALYFIDETGLYGRHWGAVESIDCLHFELCYYQGVELAINAGLPLFDPGTQGEHKLIRGFTPTLSHSYHAIYDARFATAISEYCERERAQTAGYLEAARAALPFKQNNPS
jgi:predicted N-acyltransferase